MKRVMTIATADLCHSFGIVPCQPHPVMGIKQGWSPGESGCPTVAQVRSLYDREDRTD